MCLGACRRQPNPWRSAPLGATVCTTLAIAIAWTIAERTPKGEILGRVAGPGFAT